MDITDIPPKDQAARVLAAIAYSGQQKETVAKKALGKSASTLRRITGANPKGAQSMDELYKIAEVCNVPKAFMEEGWARYDDEERDLPAALRRLKDLEDQVDQLRHTLNGLNIENEDDARAFLAVVRERQGKTGQSVGKRALRSRRVLDQSKESA